MTTFRRSRSRRSACPASLAGAALGLALLLHTRLLPAQITGEDVNRSIERGIEFLRAAQQPNGGWPYNPEHEPGLTALVTLAFVHAGVPRDDPALQKAMVYLLSQRPRTTYAGALVSMVLTEIDAERYQATIRGIWTAMENAQGPDGTWGYHIRPRFDGGGDHSNSQFAVLAMLAARKAGVPIDSSTWLAVMKHFRDLQNPDGGWGYSSTHRPSQSTVAMTAAGIASLEIVGEFATRQRHLCGHSLSDANIAAGIVWLSRPWDVSSFTTHTGYACYAIERVGILTGQKYIGSHDWYRELATALVRWQNPRGGWGGGGNTAIVNTAFAILTLAKGKSPILVNKLQWSGDWNNDRHDMKHLTDFVSAIVKQKVSWQVLPEQTPLTEWLAAPLLYLNGHNAPRLTPEAAATLKGFLDEGGVLFAEACCGKKEFDEGFQQLMQKLFPDRSLEPLGPEHDVYRMHFAIAAKAAPLKGLSWGCRTAVIYSARDHSCAWDQGSDSDLGFKVGTNVALYAMGMMPLRDKLDPVVLRPKEKAAEPSDHLVARGALTIARIRHNGDWDTDAGTLRELQSFLRNSVNMSVTAEGYSLSLTSPDLPNFPVLYMTGHRKFTLSDAERTALRQHLERGGFLFADACCGRPAFDESFRQEMGNVFPKEPLARLPVTHPVFRAGFDLERLDYTPAVTRGGQPPDSIRLEGIPIEGRVAIVYSSYDLGCAIDGHCTPDCHGLRRDSALNVAANVVIYALGF